MELSEDPVPSTIRVAVDGETLEDGWVYDAAANAVFKPHKFVYDAQTYAKPGVAEVDLAEGTCDNALASDLRGVAEALAPALAASCGVFDADAAIKIQRNASGAFACHYDNAGPPSKRSVTAVLYLGRADGAAVAEDDGGALDVAQRRQLAVVRRRLGKGVDRALARQKADCGAHRRRARGNISRHVCLS